MFAYSGRVALRPRSMPVMVWCGPASLTGYTISFAKDLSIAYRRKGRKT